MTAVGPRVKRIPRSCSDVFRFWAASGLGLGLSLVATAVIEVMQSAGLIEDPTGRRSVVELDFGAQLVGWNSFAIAYLVLGLRAFARCDRAELVRRIQGSPLPRSALARYLLAGGGGPTWAIVVTTLAFTTIVTAVQTREDSTVLVLGLMVATVVLCWVTITFSFALHYASRDIERGGLEFSGSEEPVFADYLYLAIGCSATFGTTDTAILTSAMRRTVSTHGIIAFVLNTAVIGVMISVVVG